MQKPPVPRQVSVLTVSVQTVFAARLRSQENQEFPEELLSSYVENHWDTN